jgi:hypothetical protein
LAGFLASSQLGGRHGRRTDWRQQSRRECYRRD